MRARLPSVPGLGFGALPIQRVPSPEAERIVRKAYAHGVRFFDTARFYTDSEEKPGRAFEGVRPEVVLATKTTATDRATPLEHLEVSLGNLRTDYVDIIQLHNREALLDPADPNSAHQALVEARDVVPIWGIQRESELDEFLALEARQPELSAELEAVIAKDRSELSGAFCRGCGYCLPCPAEIPIHWAARMPQLLRRSPTATLLTTHWRELMARIEACTECRDCASRCPYELDTPELLKSALEDYRTFL